MKSAKISTTTVAYFDQGRGAPLLLVHGFPLDHTMWDAQIPALVKTRRVIAPDLRGFGRSPLGHADPKTGITMEQYADDLAELLDALDVTEPIIYAGFSMGGYIGWQFVRKYASRLRALILCDTRAAADNDEGRAGRLKMADHIAEWGSAAPRKSWRRGCLRGGQSKRGRKRSPPRDRSSSVRRRLRSPPPSGAWPPGLT